MKKRFVFLMIMIMTAGIWSAPPYAAVVFAAEEPQIVAESAVLIDAQTGKVLYDKNMHVKMHPASTTKIITGILAIETLPMEQVLTADQEAAGVEPTNIAMKDGEQFTVEQLLNAMLIRSANDTAVVLAKAMGGSIEGFATIMNAKAKEVGALNTNFVNPNGLTDAEHLTTAYDLAMMARYAMENPVFRQLVQKAEYTIPPTNATEEARTVKSTNEMTYNIKTIKVDGQNVTTKYEAATGVKTGFTKQAGRCFAASAMKDGRELISVVLLSDQQNVTLDSIKLLDYGFDYFENHMLASMYEYQEQTRVKSGKANQINAVLAEDAIITIDKGTLENLDIILEADLPESTTAPIDKGTIIGKYNVYVEGVLEKQIDILAAETIEESSWVNLFSTIGEFLKKMTMPVLVILSVVILLVILYVILALRLSGRRMGRRRRRRGKEPPMFSKTRSR